MHWWKNLIYISEIVFITSIDQLCTVIRICVTILMFKYPYIIGAHSYKCIYSNKRPVQPAWTVVMIAVTLHDSCTFWFNSMCLHRLGDNFSSWFLGGFAAIHIDNWFTSADYVFQFANVLKL